MSNQSRPNQPRPVQSGSDQARSLPERPSLRFLKLEAKERLAAGEFTTLHEAQLTVAREHGQPSWAALKRVVEADADRDGPALGQVRWVISRFAGAGGPDWAAPEEAELAEHLEPRFLEHVRGELVRTLAGRPHLLRGELEVEGQAPLAVRALAGGMRIEATAAEQPPHRLTMLRIYPAGGKVADGRVAGPPSRAEGTIPEAVAQIAEAAFGELGLAGLVVAGTGSADTGSAGTGSAGTGSAGTGSAGAGWAVARGWADLDRAEALRPDHRFPAGSVTKLITATAVLRLVADGRVGLDERASGYLGRVRLADDAVTVRELLAHTAGVGGPDESFAAVAPEPAVLTGAVVPCPWPRNEFRYSGLGYVLLGMLISGVTGAGYADAANGLVLGPLGMTSSWFPERWPEDDREAVTGYHLDAGDGTFRPETGQVSTMTAAGGLWTTAGDLIRFAAGWRSLLPPGLAEEAVRPVADRGPGQGQVGLGWILNTGRDVAGHPGVGPGASAALVTGLGGGPAAVVLSSRKVPTWPLASRVLRAMA